MKFIRIIKSSISTNDKIKVFLQLKEQDRNYVSKYWNLFDKQGRIALYYGSNLISFVEDEDDIISYILNFYTGKPEIILKIKLNNKIIYED